MEELQLLDVMESVQILERKLTMSLVDSGLRMPQYRVLLILKENGSSTVSDLSLRLRITRAAASILINEMIKNGYLTTRENLEDRRSFHIVLSENGQEKFLVAQKSLYAALQKLTADFSEEIIKGLNAFSESILKGEKNHRKNLP